jgi:hypothetical protein
MMGNEKGIGMLFVRAEMQRLKDAAGELLEALKLAEGHLAFWEEEHHCEEIDPADCCECTDLAQIREVIAKAGGGE